MSNAERKRTSLLANLGDLNRPVRVRLVRVMGREWWAIAADDTWPGMVMDLRRLGFESMAMGDEVLVREGAPAYEPQMDGPASLKELRPFPTIHPTIRIHKESSTRRYSDWDEDEQEDKLEPEDLDDDE